MYYLSTLHVFLYSFIIQQHHVPGNRFTSTLHHGHADKTQRIRGAIDARIAEEQARQIFETFPPGLQRALESGKLDEVNKVLAKMSVDEAEEVVEKLGQGGMLSLEEGVIDATTEEGQRVMGEIERNRRMPGQAQAQGQEQGTSRIEEVD